MSTYVRLAAACCILAASVVVGMAVPAPREAPIDPCGTYVGSCGARAVYDVHIRRDPEGPLIAVWRSRANGEAHYVGTWTVSEGVWRERYWPDERLQIRSCGPWLWRVTSTEPLMFDGTGDWTLEKREADF